MVLITQRARTQRTESIQFCQHQSGYMLQAKPGVGVAIIPSIKGHCSLLRKRSRVEKNVATNTLSKYFNTRHSHSRNSLKYTPQSEGPSQFSDSIRIRKLDKIYFDYLLQIKINFHTNLGIILSFLQQCFPSHV